MRRFSYTCVSKSGTGIYGTYTDTYPKFDRDQINVRIMCLIAECVEKRHLPWDPFNIELIVKARKESAL